MQECPSGPDPLDGWVEISIFFLNEFCISMTLTPRVLNYKFSMRHSYGNEAGRDCSGRGICNYRAEPAKGSSELDASTRPRCSNKTHFLCCKMQNVK